MPPLASGRQRGQLSSTLFDMMRFAAAALGDPVPDTTVTEGFRVAQTPYACSAANSALSDCQADTARTGLAWSVQPADQVSGRPVLYGKNGACRVSPPKF